MFASKQNAKNLNSVCRLLYIRILNLQLCRLHRYHPFIYSNSLRDYVIKISTYRVEIREAVPFFKEPPEARTLFIVHF